MIERIETPSADILAFEAVGTASKEDYSNTILPQIQKAYAEGRKVRFLYHLGKRFEGFSPAAAWEDFKLGAQYLRVFERCAVVTDHQWIRNLSAAFGSLIPCAVRTYPDHELSNALSWLNSGEIQLSHSLNAEKGLLSVEIQGPLQSEDFEVLAHVVDPWLEKHSQLNGIVIHADKFPGWENLGALIEHIQFVKAHHRKVKRVAIAADGAFPSLLPALGSHFVQAEVKHFGSDEVPQAQLWASEKTA